MLDDVISPELTTKAEPFSNSLLITHYSSLRSLFLWHGGQVTCDHLPAIVALREDDRKS